MTEQLNLNLNLDLDLRVGTGCQEIQTGDYCSYVVTQCPTLVTPWTVSHQAPLSMGFSRQEHWSGLPFPPPGIKSISSVLAGRFFTI